MTTLTDDGLAYLADHAAGVVPEPINTVAVGTGTAPEAHADSSLDSPIYRASTASDNARLVPSETDATRYQGVIDVTGGNEVPAGTEITEIALMVARENDPDILVMREVQSASIVDAGHVVSYGLPLKNSRA